MTRSAKAIAMMIIAGSSLAAICSASTSDISGKWIEKGQADTEHYIEIFSDNTVKMHMPEMDLDGTWTILNDGRVKMDLSYLWSKMTILGRMQGSSLLLDMDGKPATFVKLGTSQGGNGADKQDDTPAPVPSFSPTDLKSTQQWADSLKGRLGAVAKQGNALVLKEAQEAMRRDVAAIVGSSVKWTLHVAAVTENGAVKFTEIFDTESFAAPILSMEQSLTIYFASPPAFSPDALRSFKAGDPVTVTATVKEAALKRDSYGINIVLNTLSTADNAASTSATVNDARSEAARARTSVSDAPVPRKVTVSIKNGTISLLGLSTGHISVSVDGEQASTIKAGESISDSLVVGSTHTMTATMNGRRIVRTFVVNNNGGTIVLMPQDFR